MTAVDHVSFSIRPGQILGLVGESGSGKSTISRVLCGLQREYEGSVRLNDVELTPFRTRVQWRSIQMVFQDPFASLDPRLTVEKAIGRLLHYHQVIPLDQIKTRCAELLDLVQLPKSYLSARPGEMSGGQRQRVAIARALALEPKLLIADEAVAALDVSVQAGVVNLLAQLREQLDLSILFIAHDLAIVRNLCSDVIVMQHGRLVEQATSESLFSDPQTDYTRQLLDAVPTFSSSFLDD